MKTRIILSGRWIRLRFGQQASSIMVSCKDRLAIIKSQTKSIIDLLPQQRCRTINHAKRSTIPDHQYSDWRDCANYKPTNLKEIKENEAN